MRQWWELVGVVVFGDVLVWHWAYLVVGFVFVFRDHTLWGIHVNLCSLSLFLGGVIFGIFYRCCLSVRYSLHRFMFLKAKLVGKAKASIVPRKQSLVWGRAQLYSNNIYIIKADTALFGIRAAKFAFRSREVRQSIMRANTIASTSVVCPGMVFIMLSVRAVFYRVSRNWCPLAARHVFA